MQELLTYIRSFSEFSDEGWAALRSILTEVRFKKGEYLVRQGTVCHSLYFVCQGYCRVFSLQNGEEVNQAFYFEQDFATSMNSYLFGLPSAFFMQAGEPLVALRLDKARILEASRRVPELELIAKRNLQLIAAKQERQLALYRLLTAAQRYDYLEKQEPQLLQRVPLSFLASYLGVKRETLSRIRSRRVRK